MDLPPKLWFRLQQLKAWWQGTVEANEPLPASAHRMCPNCRALIDRGAASCPLCGMSLRRSRAETSRPGRVMGLPVPSTATSVLVAANVALYGLSWYLTSAGAFSPAGSSPSGMLGSISPGVLLALGGKYGPLIENSHQWWRLITACFLHGGLLHIGFNLWCLVDLGPEVESLFPTQKYIFMYLVTGVCGFLLSLWWTPGLSIGASAPILGLIGVLIGVTFHHGSLGRQYRSRLWRWLIYIFVIGMLPGTGVDNAAHVGGLLSGLALGYFIPEGDPQTRTTETLWSALSLVSILVMVGAFVLMALHLNQL